MHGSDVDQNKDHNKQTRPIGPLCAPHINVEKTRKVPSSVQFFCHFKMYKKQRANIEIGFPKGCLGTVGAQQWLAKYTLHSCEVSSFFVIPRYAYTARRPRGHAGDEIQCVTFGHGL